MTVQSYPGGSIPSVSGQSGKYLTTNGSNLSWGTVSAGGMTLIATATPSAASSVQFANIPTIYKQLYLTYKSVTESSGWGWSFRLNGDSGSNYSFFAAYLNGSTTVVTANGTGTTEFGNSGAYTFVPFANTTSTSFGRLARGELTIQRADQAEEHQVFWRAMVTDNTPSPYGSFHAQGIYRGTSAPVTQIDLVRLSTQTITGTFYLYGMS